MSDIPYRESGYATVQASLEHVSVVADKLKTFCRYRGIDEARWPEIELAFCEGLNNAIEHACHEDTSKSINVRWTWEEEWLTLEMEDPGEYVSTNSASSLPDDPYSESGRGTFLIQSTMDEVSHTSCEFGHRLTMKKRLHKVRPLIDRMEEMYVQLQTTSSELHTALARLSAIEGMSTDLSCELTISKIIANGINRLRSFSESLECSVWILEKGELRQEGRDKISGAPLSVSLSEKSSILTKVFCSQSPVFRSYDDDTSNDDPLISPKTSLLVLPIEFQEDPRGVLALRVPVSDTELLQMEIAGIAKTFAKMLGIAFASNSTHNRLKEQERAEAQLVIASEIQRSLLPSVYPSNSFCKVTGTCVTAMEVGGDYIDAVEIRDVGLLIVIADVMGKGVPAALLATIFRTAIRSRLNLAETPGWLLSKINKQIHEELGHLSMFITAQAAFYTYEKRKLKLASAGHCPALLLKNGTDAVTHLAAEGMPLGIDPDDIYEERLIDMDTGDRVLFMTDGMYEAENLRGEMLGLDGLSARVPQIWEKGFEFVTQRAFSVVEDHIQGLPPSDDKTLMAMEIL